MQCVCVCTCLCGCITPIVCAIVCVCQTAAYPLQEFVLKLSKPVQVTQIVVMCINGERRGHMEGQGGCRSPRSSSCASTVRGGSGHMGGRSGGAWGGGEGKWSGRVKGAHRGGAGGGEVANRGAGHSDMCINGGKWSGRA